MQGVVAQRVDALLKSLPGFASAGFFQDAHGETYQSIKGSLTPIRNASHLPYFLNALERRLSLDLQSDGELAFPINVRPHPVAVEGFQGQTFTVELQVYPAPRHPEIYVLNPSIGLVRFPGLHHLYLTRHHFYPHLNRICVYGPHLGLWEWRTGHLETLILWLAQWVVSFEVWTLSSRWFGPEASHDLSVVHRLERRFKQCSCGSGQPRAECPRGCGQLRRPRGQTLEQRLGARILATRTS